MRSQATFELHSAGSTNPWQGRQCQAGITHVSMNGAGMPHQSQILLYGRHTLSYSNLLRKKCEQQDGNEQVVATLSSQDDPEWYSLRTLC